MAGPWEAYQQPESGPWEAYAPKPESNVLKDAGMGALRGASNIGATILSPLDAMMGKTDRRQQLDEFFKDNADTSSVAYKGGELASEIAGTAGVGGALAKVVKFAPRLAKALETGGFSLGTSTGSKLADAGIRTAAGATVGGASAALVDPDSAGAGAVIGGALPGAVKLAGAAGKALAPKAASPEVGKLYERAKELGIDIPADRIGNSRPMNALASSLNYVPFSGRAATEEKMVSQFNRAISRTFGQDSDNVTGALRRAQLDLGTKFEQTLSQNNVRYDKDFVDDLVKNFDEARNTLTRDQVDRLDKVSAHVFEKAHRDVHGDLIVEGKAAYNLKKMLDKLGRSPDSEFAYHAREIQKSLMGALDRSMGTTQAAAFKKLRQQYGNMLDVQGYAKPGAEGGVSIGRLANETGIRNKELGELVDIAAQFLKVRESPHGSAQRVVLGTGAAMLGGATGTLPLMATGVAAGRGANMMLNSQTMKNAMLGKPGSGRMAALPENALLRSLIYQESQGSQR